MSEDTTRQHTRSPDAQSSQIELLRQDLSDERREHLETKLQHSVTQELLTIAELDLAMAQQDLAALQEEIDRLKAK